MTWNTTVSGYNLKGELEANKYMVTTNGHTPDMDEHQMMLMYARQYFLKDYPDYNVDIKIEAKRQ